MPLQVVEASRPTSVASSLPSSPMGSSQARALTDHGVPTERFFAWASSLGMVEQKQLRPLPQ
jgi:hypothetical protein